MRRNLVRGALAKPATMAEEEMVGGEMVEEVEREGTQGPIFWCTVGSRTLNPALKKWSSHRAYLCPPHLELLRSGPHPSSRSSRSELT